MDKFHFEWFIHRLCIDSHEQMAAIGVLMPKHLWNQCLILSYNGKTTANFSHPATLDRGFMWRRLECILNGIENIIKEWNNNINKMIIMTSWLNLSHPPGVRVAGFSRLADSCCCRILFQRRENTQLGYLVFNISVYVVHVSELIKADEIAIWVWSV